MQLKVSLKGVLFIIGILGMASGAIILFFVSFNLTDIGLSSSVYTSSPILNEPTGLIQNPVSSRGLPVRLMIPKI